MKRSIRLISTAILTFACIQGRPQSITHQNDSKPITLSYKSAQLRLIFDNLRTNYGYYYYITDDILNLPASIKVTNEKIQRVLYLLSLNKPVIFSCDRNVIRMYRRINLPIPNKFIMLPEVGGVVIDEDGKRIPGVTVNIKRTDKGTSTNANGEFKFQYILMGDTLIFTHIGKKTEEYIVRDQPSIYVTLINKMDEMSAVTVNTGFQELKIEQATGSFKQTDYSLIPDIPRFNIQEGFGINLSGYLAASKTAPGPNMMPGSIRGVSTIRGYSYPLIFLDGLPFYGDIYMLNSDDIESITVANDASSTAIYGTRASNGVILITTKKAKWNHQFRLSYSSFTDISQKPDLNYLPRVQSTDYIDLEEKLFDADYYDNFGYPTPSLSPVAEALLENKAGKDSIINLYRTQNRNWYLSKYFYQSGVTTQHSINVSGSVDSIAWMGSMSYGKSYFNEKGIQHNRLTASGNMLFKHNKLSTISNFYYSRNWLYDNFVSLSSEIPYLRLADERGNPLHIPYQYRTSYIDTLGNNKLLDWRYRPLQELRNADHVSNNHYLTANTRVNYQFTPWLQVQALYQFGKLKYDQRIVHNLETYYARNLINRYSELTPSGVIQNLPATSIFDEQKTISQIHNGRIQVNIDHNWNENELKIISGTELQSTNMKMQSTRNYGTNSTGILIDYDSLYSILTSPGLRRQIPRANKPVDSTDRYFSYFGNAFYTWSKKITLSFSLRQDQSNRYTMGVNKKFNPLWATGMIVHLHRFTNYPVRFPDISIRSTIGITGNKDNQASRRTTIRYVDDLNNNSTVAYIDNPVNTSLQFEKMRTINLGMDVKTADSNLKISFDAYWKKGKNLLGYSEPNPTSGVSLTKNNTSRLSAHGIDINLHTVNLKKPFRWETMAWMSYTTNKVKSEELLLKESWQYADPYWYIPRKGHPVNAIFAYPSAGLDSLGNPVGYLINGERSSKYIDIIKSSDPNTLKYIGSATPTLFGNITNIIQFKRFVVSFQISGKFNYYFRRTSFNSYDMIMGTNVHGDYYKRWQKPGDEKTTTVPALTLIYNPEREAFYKYSELLVERGDHIRLQNMQLLYFLEKKKLFGLPYSRLQMAITLNNLGIIWRANDERLDPDVMPGMLPVPKSISLSINAQF